MTMREIVNIGFRERAASYDILIEPGAFAAVGKWMRTRLGGGSRKIAVFSNKKVFGLYGASLIAQLNSAGFTTPVFLMGDGERYKNSHTLDRALAFLGKNGFSRSDAVIALGGGVVGDLTGFAASVYLRGIAFIQIPTTLLAMIDSSVGGKTAINTSQGKNLVGSFYQPAGVLIDPLVLKTLPKRELTAGFCEAIKQGAVGGPRMLQSVGNLLETFPVASKRTVADSGRYGEEMARLIAAQVAFKAKIVRGDEREEIGRSDARSRKILNFGHTLAHAIEKVTAYKYLKHGEAVGYGIRFAANVSKKLDLLSADEVNLLNDVVHRAGALPSIAHLKPAELLASFKFDKKVIGDSLQWVLLRGIGKPVIVPQSDIPRSILTDSLRDLIHN